MASDDGNILMEDCRIIFRNFEGKEGKYNRKGDRNFCVLLDPDFAEFLSKEGWNIKTLKAREEGDEPQPYLMVSVGFDKGRPPKVVLITSKGRTILTEDEVEILDWVDIRTVDMIIRPYHWNVNDAHGTKAYLKSIFVTVDETPLDLKYADLVELDGLPARAGKVDE